MSIEQSTHYLFLRHFNLSVVDGGDNVGRMLSIDGATHRTTRDRHASHLLAGSQHLLHGSGQLVGIGTLTENLGHLDHLIESNVSVVLHYTSAPPLQAGTVLLLLTITRRLIELTDDQRGSARNHFHLQVKWD